MVYRWVHTSNATCSDTIKQSFNHSKYSYLPFPQVDMTNVYNSQNLHYQIIAKTMGSSTRQRIGHGPILTYMYISSVKHGKKYFLSRPLSTYQECTEQPRSLQKMERLFKIFFFSLNYSSGILLQKKLSCPFKVLIVFLRWYLEHALEQQTVIQSFFSYEMEGWWGLDRKT